ncbi:MAG: protein translocase subunit SecD, partial [Candidatus Levyibacteriota bacterium]
MKQHPRFALLFVLLLALIGVVINLSTPFNLNFSIPNPFTNHPITVKESYPGIPFINHSGFNLSLRQGLDLQGGTSITLRANMKTIPEADRDNALNSAKTVIEKRINFFGVSEPVVQTAKIGDDYRILVDIPGITDVNQAVSIVGKTAQLTFWESSDTKSSSTSAATTATQSAMQDLRAGIPIGLTQYLGPNPEKTDLSGQDLKSAAVQFDPQTGQPIVGLVFTSDGAKKFADISKRNVGKIVAIALDNQVVEAPTIRTPILDGQGQISGGFTTQTANDLVVQLNAGALPVSLSVLQQQAIGATLGQQSVQASMVAGILGFFVIILFMLILYGRLGIIACLALIIYALLDLSLFRLIPVTLTLAGIAGFILSVGIAVDANILIFERMKEELRRGRTLTNSIDLGFSRAWP